MHDQSWPDHESRERVLSTRTTPGCGGRGHRTVSAVPDPRLEYAALMVPTQSPWNHSLQVMVDEPAKKYV